MRTPPIKILVVEDEPVIGLDIGRRLETLGYQPCPIAASAQEALEFAALHKPDLALMDIVLSSADGLKDQGRNGRNLDGIDAAAVLRAEMRIPVVYMTSHSEENVLRRAQSTDPFGYLLKPFDDRELRVCIEMALYKFATDRKLLENERKLATMLCSIGDAVVGASDQGVIQFFNPMAEKLTGWSAADIVGKPFMQVIRILDPRTRLPLLDMERLLSDPNGRLPYSDSGLLLDRHGAELPIDLSATSYQAQGDDFFGVALVFRDVTERRKTEEALKQSVCNLRRTLEETVTALAVTAEKRDPYTAGHQQRVAKLASAIAEKLGLEADRVDGLRVASLLHDIGKIYVPAEILAKPALLTSLEMELMKTHSEVGHEILKSVSFPWPVAEMVLQHHERLDGGGYPCGLRGEDIMFEARILMVADVVEAMSSHRPYRAALGRKLALEEISLNSGRRYDKRVVDACVALFCQDDFSLDG